jgi:hypothetical protein
MNNEEKRINELHSIYQMLTGLSVPLSVGMHYAWGCWLLKGWNEDDLRLTIEFLRRKIKAGRKTLACFRFSSFIGNTDFFAEDLAEARALARNPVVDTGRAQALHSTGRAYEAPQAKVRSAAQVMAGNEALKKLLELRDNL